MTTSTREVPGVFALCGQAARLTAVSLLLILVACDGAIAFADLLPPTEAKLARALRKVNGV